VRFSGATTFGETKPDLFVDSLLNGKHDFLIVDANKNYG
jgi:hypothetical protein